MKMWMPSVMNEPKWQAVNSLPTGGGLMHALEMAITDVDVAAERFESDGGGYAILLPLRPCAEGEVPAIVVSDAPAEVAELLFLDPGEASGALSLLASRGRGARSVRVALPRDADTTGLIRDAGRVTVATGLGSPTAYELFRVDDRATLNLRGSASGSKLGEDADVLEQRSKWFQAREGGPD
jgi:hypothetical protein